MTWIALLQVAAVRCTGTSHWPGMLVTGARCRAWTSRSASSTAVSAPEGSWSTSLKTAEIGGKGLRSLAVELKNGPLERIAGQAKLQPAAQ